MRKVFNKADELTALQYDGDNLKQVVEFTNYRNRHPLFDGDQVVIDMNTPSGGRGKLYVSHGDWILKDSMGNVVRVLSHEKFIEKYGVVA